MADAVAGAGDVVEVVQGGVPRQVGVGVLLDLVAGLDVEGDPSDRAERAQRDDHAVEARVRPIDACNVSVGGDELQAAHCGRQVAVAIPGPVGAGRDGAGDRDVRQRAHVVQGVAVGLEKLRHDPEPCSGRDGDGHRLQIHYGIERLATQLQQDLGTVRQLVERVPRAQRTHVPRLGDDAPGSVQTGRFFNADGSVADVASPVQLVTHVLSPCGVTSLHYLSLIHI